MPRSDREKVELTGDEAILEEAREAYEIACEVENENRLDAMDDIRFARLGEQWPEKVKRDRELDGRPCLTINRLPAFIRQVVNDARQNKPAIAVHPVDSGSDPETAEIFSGLIRNIEQSSDAEVAYDTALDFAVTGGFGYFRINTRYTSDDSFEQDLVIERVSNPFSVYGDPNSMSADSADWNVAFVVESVPKAQFEKRWKGAEAVDWEVSGYASLKGPWMEGDRVLVAEYWKREEVPRKIVALSDGQVVGLDVYTEQKATFDALGVAIVGRPREITSKKVTQYIMTGAEVLETVEWAGKYIPIIPVYGEELVVDGKRHLRSLVRDAKDPQRMFNYWRPLALDTPIPTPSGWTTMGAIREGEQVFDEAGQPCNVIGKSPVHINRKCFRVEFDDGSQIIADAEHPWRVEERAGRTSSGTTWQTRDLTTADLESGKHFVPVAKPFATPDADLPVPPYVLGMWLGDGHAMAGRITPGDEDLDEVIANIEATGERVGVITRQPDRCASFTVLGMAPKLRALGVLGHKHIPAAYLRASEAQRWALLQGLMDSDGSINRVNGACGFTTTSDAIASGLSELLRTLGIKAKSVYRQGRASKLVGGGNQLLPSRQFYFSAYADEPVFGLARKADLLGGRPQHRRRTKRHAIAKISRTTSVPVQCIAIDAPSHLFLAGEGMVPTHNTTSTELVALAPKAPFIGRKGAFETDASKWATANVQTHAYIEYDGPDAPQRQPFSGVPAGAIQESLNAADDMKSIMGLHDASLGARSNETSGRAIMARQREGDVSTFHYIDNLSRSIRHAGRILIDLIPKVYSTARMVRVLGPDGKPHQVPLKEPVTIDKRDENGQVEQITRTFDLAAGKYDVTVSAGPSFTSRREEAATQMIELIRAYPPAAPVIGDLLARNLDWPGADEVATRLRALVPPEARGDGAAPNPEVEQAKVVVQQLQSDGAKLAEELKAALTKLEARDNDNALARMKLENEAEVARAQAANEALKIEIDRFNAETNRLKALAPKGVAPDPNAAPGLDARSQAAEIVADDLPPSAADLEEAEASPIVAAAPPMQPPPSTPPALAAEEPEEGAENPDAMPPAASDLDDD